MIDMSGVKAVSLSGQSVKKIQDQLGNILWQVAGPGPTPTGNMLDFTGAIMDYGYYVFADDKKVAIEPNKMYSKLKYKYKITRGSQWSQVDAAQLGWGVYLYTSDTNRGTGDVYSLLITQASTLMPVYDQWQTVNAAGGKSYLSGIYETIYTKKVDTEMEVYVEGELVEPVKTLKNGVLKATFGDYCTIEFKDFEYEIVDCNWDVADLSDETLTLDSTETTTYKALISDVDCKACNKRFALIGWSLSLNEGYKEGSNYMYAVARKTDGTFTRQQISNYYNGKIRTAIGTSVTGKFGIEVTKKGIIKKGSTQVNVNITQDATDKNKILIYDTDNSADAGFITFSSLKYYSQIDE